MSLIVANGELVRNMWPATLPRLRRDNRPIDTLRPDEVVPDGFDAVDDWAYVAKRSVRSDISRQHILVHAAPHNEQPGRFYQVTIRLQGFVKKLDIATLGNWDETLPHAMRAEQTLVLCDGSFKSAFKAQLHALDVIRDVIHAGLNSHDTRRSLSGHLRLQRRVFTKVPPGETIPYVLKKKEDPNGKAEKIKHMWGVADRLAVYCINAEGEVEPLNPGRIKTGDFVDATVIADIVRNVENKRISVYFGLQQVIQLQSAANVVGVAKERPQPSDAEMIVVNANEITASSQA